MKTKRIFFEPWGLGDTLIAAAAMQEATGSVALACKSRWHAIVRATFSTPVDLVSVEPAYAVEPRQSRIRASANGVLDPALPEEESRECLVLNIRGDPRDWLAARKLFPGARIQMSGWIQFAPHYVRLLDLPFATRLLPVRNRYRAWAELAGVSFAQLEARYRARQAQAPASGPIIVHTGTRRRSRQYPHVAELAQLLEQQGYTVQLIAGPNNPLPSGVAESRVTSVVDQALIQVLRAASLVISNDSGPMHLAALLGCRTLAVCRVTNINEWIPPATAFTSSPQMPRGYHMDSRYNTDEILDDWPSPESIAAKAQALLAAANLPAAHGETATA